MLNDPPGPASAEGNAYASILSNGTYHVLLTASGTGYSAVPGHALTRWRQDPTEDRHGYFVYLRDEGTHALWSAGLQPVGSRPERYASQWTPGSFEIVREEHGIETRLQVCVHPAAPLELRKVSLRNRSDRPRRIEATSYLEVVLDAPEAHAAHPVFSQMFIETEFVEEHGVLLARRRPRRRGEEHPWMAHGILESTSPRSGVEFETDRSRFVGRGRSLSSPLARMGAALSRSTGSVLDPILSLRGRVDLLPGETKSLTFILGAGRDRDAAIRMVRDLDVPDPFASVLAAARGRETTGLQGLGISQQEAETFHALAAGLLYSDRTLKRVEPKRVPDRAPHADLASLAIPAHQPLVVVHADQPEAATFLSVLERAHAFWNFQGLPVSIVVLAGDPPPSVPAAGGEPTLRWLRSRDLSDEARRAIDARADLLVADRFPTWQNRLGPDTGNAPRDTLDPRPSSGSVRPDPSPSATPLRFFNGLGGFSPDGTEYVIRLRHEPGLGLRATPEPWINVIANEHFGFLVSERGSISTWSGNSRLHRLTPWSNDPLEDPHSEAFYLRDEDTADFWSPFPGPVPAEADYEVRHGFGTTRCEHASHDLDQSLLVFASRTQRIQILTLRVRNRSDRARRLSVWAYRRLVLGALPQTDSRFVSTQAVASAQADASAQAVVSARSDLLLAWNPASGVFAGGIAFASIHGSNADGSPVPLVSSFTTDRSTFLGPHGTPESPAALLRGGPLDGTCGSGQDPCFAQRAAFTIAPQGEREIVLLFGEADSPEAALALTAEYREPGAVARALDEVTTFWRDLLGRLVIRTPEPALDGIVNGWMPYQALVCRIWARSAFYQSGGAFGYRDQLQDAAALIAFSPDLVREQILLHAAHQFVEGDVLHWWHPPEGAGIRTRFADDLLWLPFVLSFYVRWTGDWAILDEAIPYLTARPLQPGEDEAYLVPARAPESEDLYGHCCRAIDRNLRTGPHGLPLFGTGDWNDGMNRVGREGKGESVWMGFFLDSVIASFLPLAARRGDRARAARYGAFSAELRSALEGAGWDGAWYRRGYYDDGAPLGSSTSEECRIDGLVQAWAVLSGAARPARGEQAMDEVERQLVSETEGLIRLLTPPFDRTPHDPGYIKGYPPGVRENGGQYTHAALWIVGALAKLGRRERVATLLRMLSPISHTGTPEEVARYRLEPYVIAADVYGSPPHVGRGGWSWYTGSAGWMIRVALESLLGFQIEGGEWMLLRPCIPDGWPGFSLSYRIPGEATLYEVEVRRVGVSTIPVARAILDGAACAVDEGCARIPLLHDGGIHHVRIELGGGVPEDPR